MSNDLAATVKQAAARLRAQSTDGRHDIRRALNLLSAKLGIAHGAFCQCNECKTMIAALYAWDDIFNLRPCGYRPGDCSGNCNVCGDNPALVEVEE